MVDGLRRKGITDERVLAAIDAVPRHWFLDSSLDNLAYEDRALPILCDQTISQPSTVAMQTQLLQVEPGMKVLEIGTGSGYQTAVLWKMGVRVFSIERQKGLFDRTKKMLFEIGCNAKCFLGDGYQGLTEVDYGPYDRVLVTCGAPSIPMEVMKQLKTGGIMVIPVGTDQQEMLRIYKDGETPNQWRQEQCGAAYFVPMLEGKNFTL